MKQYEITFITREEGDPGVAAAIQAAGGHITSERTLGRRQLAYPIAKETAGYYTTYRFDAEPAVIGDLTRKLELMAGVMRQLTVEIPNIPIVQASLEVEDLKEAKELETEPTAAEPVETEKTVPAADVKERDQKLQEQLDKLLAGEQNAGE